MEDYNEQEDQIEEEADTIFRPSRKRQIVNYPVK